MKYLAGALVVVALIGAMVVSDIPSVGMAAADRESYSQVATVGLVAFVLWLMFGDAS